MDFLVATYNSIIEILIESGARLIQIPLHVILSFLCLLVIIIFFIMRKLANRKKKVFNEKFFQNLLIFFILFSWSVALDQKLYRIEKGVYSLNADFKKIHFHSDSKESNNDEEIDFENPYYDIDFIKKQLEHKFGEIEFQHETLHQAVELIYINFKGTINEKNAPKEVLAYLAIIDLTDPQIKIKITDKLDKKWMTSDFARQNDCIVAINGEAGKTPAIDSELGGWVGVWVSNGTPVMLQDTKDRPFLMFDKNNKAKYSPANEIDNEMNDEKHNALYGRFDLLVNGHFIKNTNDSSRKWQYARTIMGINFERDKLYLLVVDNKKPLSHGLKASHAARLLASFGVYNAMLCDQGGSVVMYIKDKNGPVNNPSDSKGERPVYSHFGISIEK